VQLRNLEAGLDRGGSSRGSEEEGSGEEEIAEHNQQNRNNNEQDSAAEATTRIAYLSLYDEAFYKLLAAGHLVNGNGLF
jgi:hypothetical protein